MPVLRRGNNICFRLKYRPGKLLGVHDRLAFGVSGSIAFACAMYSTGFAGIMPQPINSENISNPLLLKAIALTIIFFLYHMELELPGTKSGQ